MSTEHSFKLKNLSFENNQCCIYVDTLQKTSRPGKHLAPVSFDKLNCDSNKCVVEMLKLYVRITNELRPADEEKLLISIMEPHRGVSIVVI